jgi:hypothetical protein
MLDKIKVCLHAVLIYEQILEEQEDDSVVVYLVSFDKADCVHLLEGLRAP